MSDDVLTIQAMQKSFGGLKVIDDVSFAVRRGSRTALIGPNGAGKSTFFNLLTGYHSPDEGQVIFDGQDITRWSPDTIVRIGISRAFQISNIFPRLTVIENVRSAIHAYMGVTLNMFGKAEKIGTDETMHVLDLCGMTGEVDTPAGQLSQGDKKKLELAIALAGQPKLLFLDEPTAGMSRNETQETMDLVDRLNRDLGLSVLFTEHDMSVVFNHANRVALLHRGEIIVEGTPSEVRDNETAKEIYLGEQHL